MTITFPEQNPLVINYNHGVFINRPIHLAKDITVTLTRHTSHFIEVMVEFTITPSSNLFGTGITCSTGIEEIEAGSVSIQRITRQDGEKKNVML